MFFLYSFLLTVVFVLLSPLFLVRREKYAAGFQQRLGNLPDFETQGKPVVWLHCVSVGEAQAARPLVKSLKENFPEYKLVISTTTLTGQNLAKDIFKNEAALVFYFPFDWKFSVRRALNKIKPDVILLMETEIWFNFINEAKKRGAKIALINGRLSEKSARRYQKIKFFLERVLNKLDLALMQTAEDASRLKSIGGNQIPITVTGNIKFDLAFEKNEESVTENLRERFAISPERLLIIAASTHSPEEKIILDAFAKLRQSEAGKDARLMFVPRHPERFDEVAKLLERSAFSFTKRSKPAENSDKQADIILLDSIGELRAVYPLAKIVFVGGSLIPHGGQSILEPAAIGNAAIVTGIYTMNFDAVVKKFLAENALVQISDIGEKEQSEKLAEVFQNLLENLSHRDSLAKNASEVITKNRGAVAETVEKLLLILDKK